jgi:putative tryptophan/tyrosine transport system substrate-binding protein
MRRRDLITLLGGAAASLPLAARAQQPERLWRIGVLAPMNRERAIRQGLRGYVEGKNILIEYRVADRTDTLARDAAELVSLKVNVMSREARKRFVQSNKQPKAFPS